MQQKNECAFVCMCERAVGLCGMWCFIKQGYQTTQSETWTYTSWSVAVVKVFTHTIHIKAKGNESSPCLEILSSSYFFPTFFHWRQVQHSPLLLSLLDSHPIHNDASWSSLTFFITFYTLISFFTSQSSLFTLYFTSHIFLCI